MANINHFDFKNYRVFETEIAGRKLTVETGKMAQLANGSCLVRYGETAVLVTATASAKPRDGIDFFPLSVDFEERMYAVGRIPGSFMRREGRPSEKAILSSRQIDRPMRPLFPKDLRNDVSIVCTVLENDYDNSPEVVALLGASIAVSISDIPFDYVVAGCQVGIVDGKTVINPTSEQRAASEMDVTLCATKDKIVMIEAGAKEVPEDDMFNALMEAHEELKKVCAFIQSIKDEIGKPKFAFESQEVDHDMFDAISDFAIERIRYALDTDDKNIREERLKPIVDDIHSKFDEVYPEKIAMIDEAIYKLQKFVVRRWLLDDNKRVDGRKMDDQTLTGVGIYFALYMGIYFITFLLISFEPFDFETRFSSVAACFNNVGPGFGAVGPMGSYADYTPFSKIVLSISMLLGRLEIYPLIFAFMPSLWVKKTNNNV